MEDVEDLPTTGIITGTTTGTTSVWNHYWNHYWNLYWNKYWKNYWKHYTVSNYYDSFRKTKFEWNIIYFLLYKHKCYIAFLATEKNRI
jgi:hypothetical protein